MLDKAILCATDLTPASDRAVLAAVRLSERVGQDMALLHVLDRAERTSEGRELVLGSMRAQARAAQAGENTSFILRDGAFMERIAEESSKDYALLVLGSHGPRGLRQNLFGADILKLVRHAAVPSLVVQEESSLDGLFERIVLPVASHADIQRLLDTVSALGKAFGSEVHIFQLMRPGESASDDLLNNKLRMMNALEAAGIPMTEANEPSTTFSVGFAEQTIRYAERIGAGCIAIMSHASDEFRYIADAEKERLLTNSARIPILCA